MRVFTFFIIAIFLQASLFAQLPMDVSLTLKTDAFNLEGTIAGKKLPTLTTITKDDGHLISENNGSTSELKWQLAIEIKNAQAIVPYFDELTIENGAKIRAYSLTEDDQTRYFYKNENKITSTFALPFVKGDKIVLEAIFPNQSAYESFSLRISELGGLYSVLDFGDAPSCFANVHCSEGNPWQDQIRSVAKYMIVDGGQIGFCTGVLINNTALDCKHYFLSDQHCALTSTTEEFGQFVIYFNYEADDCTSPTSDVGLDNETVIGCTKIASSGPGDQNHPDGSDFLLMELNAIPAFYNVYYAGWNRAPLDQLEGDGVIIQHPQGDLKKIAAWDEVEAGGSSVQHLSVICVPTANGDGIVEGKSSGSPIFDKHKNIIANVTHGTSGCISDAGSNPFVGAGKFEEHWDGNGAMDFYQLKPWLDPTNSGVLSLDGMQNCSSIGIDEFQIDNSLFTLYPAPSNQYVSIKSDLIFIKVLFYSINGKLLLETTKTENIDISDLPSGIFMVEGHAENGKIGHNKFYKN